MSKINKLVTNYPVTLTPEEVSNLSQTLSSVRTAGGEGGQTYIAGDSNINVDNEHYRISFTQHATELLERDIPSAVSQLSDSANYVTKILLETVSGEIDDDINYVSAHALTAHQSLEGYLTKTSADTLYQVKGDYLVDDDITGKADKTQLSDYLTTAQYQTDSATFLTAHQDISNLASKQELETVSGDITALIPTELFTKASADTLYQPIGNYLSSNALNGYATEVELETVSGDITALIPTNYVTSGNYISGDSQYALTSGGWTKITGGGSIVGDYVPLSAKKCVIGKDNIYVNDDVLVQGEANSAEYDSFVQGYANSGKNYTISQGRQNSASNYCIAQGYKNYAITKSMAQGSKNIAEDTSFAQGTETSAYEYSLTQGLWDYASAYSLSQGKENRAIQYALAEGLANYASGESLAQGNSNTAKNTSFSQGSFNLAEDNSFADGLRNTATSAAAAIGISNSATSGSFALGKSNTATNTACAIGSANSAVIGSFAVGKGNSAFDQSIAFEQQNYASGRSMAVGHGNSAVNYSFTFGRGLDYSGPSTSNYNLGAFVVGGWNSLTNWTGTTATSPLFIVGNGGGDNTRNNALVVYRNGAVSEGTATFANGDYSHAEGEKTTAYSNYSHAEGSNTIASGAASHAEGNGTTAVGVGAHAEGKYSLTKGQYTHAEGSATSAVYEFSHTEGINTIASGQGSHAEGSATSAMGNHSHAEGTYTITSGVNSHAEGISTSAYGGQSHAEGNATCCLGDASHTEGMWAYTSGQGDHAEGVATTAVGYGIHAQGCWTEFSSTMGSAPADSTGDAGSRQVGVFVGGICNATTSHDYGEATAHNGVLAVFGNGIRRNSNSYVKSDAFLLYRDGVVSAKNYLAEGYTDGNSVYHEAYVPKAIPNTGDSTMKVQRMFVCTSDNDIIAHVNAGLANGEGCIFFRVG